MSRAQTSYGRFQVPEAPSALLRVHLHKDTPLKTVDHEPKVDVLDQEDLFAQDIHVSQFIPGAKDVDALGSCTANATTSALSNCLSETDFLALIKASSYASTVAAEEWAIKFYHACTDQTGDPSTEWPPTDCGSSGPYVVQECQRMGLVAGDQIATGAQNLVSLMQINGVLAGIPFLAAWEDPNAAGFVDGDGSLATLESQIRQGVAGGHEIYLSAVEKLDLTETGVVLPHSTVIRFRNSWSASWGDHGSGRFHLSTLVALASHCDFRQLTPKAA